MEEKKMFSKNIVIAVKKDGKVLRESNGEVQIPFNSEYSLLIKNLESRKAVLKVSIDGNDVLDGHKIVLLPNVSIDLEGFLKDSVAKNKFKFIERTEKIEDFRGTKVDDSMIRAEFWFEKEQPIVQEITYSHHHDYWYVLPYDPYWNHPTVTWKYNGGTIADGGLSYTTTNGSNYSNRTFVTGKSIDNTNCNSVNVNNDIGITVKGNEIHQDFSSTYVGNLEDQSHVIVLKLKGYSGNSIKIEKPLFVREKLECEICGTKNDSSSKFCKECGNFLDSQY
jgi:hypothetical protein